MPLPERERQAMANVPTAPPPPTLGTPVPWANRLLAQCHERPAHYERSYYPAIHLVLDGFFPATQGFVTKTQPALRLPADPSVTRTSTDSMYGSVRSREEPGQEAGLQFPDFAVVKLYTQGNEILDDPLLIVEVKRRDGDLLSAVGQLKDYIRVFRQKGRYVAGVLFIGQQIYHVEWSNRQGGPEPYAYSGGQFAGLPPWDVRCEARKFMLKLAEKNWVRGVYRQA